jgi:hypothetical protein
MWGQKMTVRRQESGMNNFLSIAVIFLPIPVFAQLCGSVSAGDRPNIVIFLADDLGYADIGVHGCKDIPTPNIDTIAKNSGTPNQ